MTPQIMNTGNLNQSILSGLSEDVLKKVTKNMTDTLSMQATEALQQGVPFGSVIENLLKMAPPSLMGGGNQPPGGPSNPNNGGNKPPQGPGGMGKNEDAQAPIQQEQPQNLNDAFLKGNAIPSPVASGSGFQLPQILPAKGPFEGASMDANGNVNQQGMASSVLSRILPAFFGGASSTNKAIVQQDALYDVAGKRQKITGTEPIQPKDRLDIASRSNTSVVSQENKISDDYNKAIEPFTKAKESFDAIQAYYKLPANGVNDLGLSYELIKSFDPNAVKEGELKNLKDTIPYLKKLGVSVKMNGQKFDPATRAQILRLATTNYNTKAKQASKIRSNYEKKVSDYGGDPKRALIGSGNNDREALIAEAKRRGLI